jgi:glycosyltransferase A (GT-A) superfamily protein (DUF2064 family)
LAGSPVAITVVAKAPIAGVAKTRLGREIGFAAAAALYRAFLLDSLAMLDEASDLLQAHGRKVNRLIVCPDERHAELLAAFLPNHWPALAQWRSGLMGGIVDAGEHGFACGAETVIVADADSPAVPPSFVLECLDQTARADVVLGPTRDGGYYLIALGRRARPILAELLLDVRYASATICQETLRRAEMLGLVATTGPAAADVDTLDDLQRLGESLAALPGGRLLATRAAFQLVGSAYAALDRWNALVQPVSDAGR